MEKNGKSYKKRLKDNIDALIPAVQSYGELLIKMQELNYEIKSGKYDSFRLNSQERFTRYSTYILRRIAIMDIPNRVIRHLYDLILT